MSWIGWLAVGNYREIINASRTEAYANRYGLNWFKPVYKNTALPVMLNDDPYVDPITDDAPWYEPRIPHSAEFYGAYPLDIDGLDSSTSSASVTESIGDGATLGLVRRSSKTLVFNLALVAASQAGAHYGFSWLQHALVTGCDATNPGDGYDLHYFLTAPNLDPPTTDCDSRLNGWTQNPLVLYPQIKRHLRGCVLTVPPTVTQKSVTADGGAVWQVTFTVQAGNPFEYAEDTEILVGWMQSSTPWVGGSPPAGASLTTTSTTLANAGCSAAVYTPLFDPLSPAVIAPPTPAGITWGGFNPPSTWYRRQLVLPKNMISDWSQMLPYIRLTTDTTESRNIRFRFYPDPLETGAPPADPCAFSGEYIVSYIPANATMVLDGEAKMVYVDNFGVRRRADSLIFSSDGSRFEWPQLSCGVQYVITLDYDNAYFLPSIDFSLTERIG